MSRCCICGHETGASSGGLLVNGRTAPICDECGELLDASESMDQQDPQRVELYSQLLGKMRSSGASNAVIESVKGIFSDVNSDEVREFIESEEKEFEREKLEEERERESTSATWSGTGGFILAGVIFLFAAIVFYVISIRDVGYGVQVANIQTTVFAAASFVAGIVNFAAAGIVKALRK